MARLPAITRPPTVTPRIHIPRQTLRQPLPAIPRAHRPFSTTTRLHPPKRYPNYDRRQYEDPRSQYERIRNARPLFTADSARAFFKKDSTRAALALLAIVAAITIYNGYEDVPVSGRRRLNLMPRWLVERIGENETEMLIQQLRSARGPSLLPDWDPRVKIVKRAMERLLKAAGLDQEEGEWERCAQQEAVWGVSPERMNQHVQTRKPGSRWRVFVIDDPETPNAFVMPGGAVFVHSGMLPLCKNEDGLAAVLGHEIAHDVAAHVGETMTRSLGVDALVIGLIAVTAWIDGGYTAHWLGSWATDYLFKRPHSRTMESEADYLGLMMMAGAVRKPKEPYLLLLEMSQGQ